MAKVVITLVKSPIGYEATPQINGMINKISHLLKVEYK